VNERALAVAAAAGSHEAFRALVDPLRRELHLFCYRMLGSFHDAEDVVQEAHLKAWRAIGSFDGRGPFRTWLYRVALNATRDTMRARRRRVLPQDLGAPRNPEEGLGEQRADIDWLEPYPEALLDAGDPLAQVELRESIRLAFVRALQLLPPKQRAVLLFRQVLGWSAADVAVALDTSVPAVNSALQRARATLEKTPDHRRSSTSRLDADGSRMVAKYVAAWEAGDIDGIVAMLTEDATHAMPPWSSWFVGREVLRTLYAGYPIWGGNPGPGFFRILPIALNGALGFAEYCREARDVPYKALALTVATLDRSGDFIVDKVSFVTPDLFEPFGLPPMVAGAQVAV
jgi:RNA polymerase sigma-70 factor (ECF subfamily)